VATLHTLLCEGGHRLLAFHERNTTVGIRVVGLSGLLSKVTGLRMRSCRTPAGESFLRLARERPGPDPGHSRCRRSGGRHDDQCRDVRRVRPRHGGRSACIGTVCCHTGALRRCVGRLCGRWHTGRETARMLIGKVDALHDDGTICRSVDGGPTGTGPMSLLTSTASMQRSTPTPRRRCPFDLPGHAVAP
jgi:hypothetical protein